MTPTDEFNEIAVKAGYVKLEPGQVVVNAHGAACAIDVFCHDCRLDKSCEYCVVRNIRDRIQEARDARV